MVVLIKTLNAILVYWLHTRLPLCWREFDSRISLWPVRAYSGGPTVGSRAELLTQYPVGSIPTSGAFLGMGNVSVRETLKYPDSFPRDVLVYHRDSESRYVGSIPAGGAARLAQVGRALGAKTERCRIEIGTKRQFDDW